MTNLIKVTIGNKEEKILETELNNRIQIEEFECVLKGFGITFEKLASKTPRNTEVKAQALAVASSVAEDSEMRNYLYNKKKLPIKTLVSFHGFRNDIIKKHEKYIIGLCIIKTEKFERIETFMGLKKESI